MAVAMSPENQSSAQQAHSDSPLDDYRDQFLTILNNPNKVRENGFVVLVRGGKDLGALQSLCVDTEKQTYNTCLTARYRLRSGPVFGTLIAAFISDLQRIGRGEPQLMGEFAPVPSTGLWQQFLQNASSTPGAKQKASSTPVNIPFAGWIEAQQGSLDRHRLEEWEWRDRLSNDNLLPKGRRLVLFGEVTEGTGEQPDWDQTLPALKDILPERVGLVLHGAPPDFSLPENDPHFLEISLPEDAGPIVDGDPTEIEHLIKYRPSALVSDVPAREDYLGINDYAESFARFILHPQTKPPFTIGIQGRWGKGKSSFMELIDIALIKLPNSTPKPSRLERILLWTRTRILRQEPVSPIQEWKDAGEEIRRQEAEVEGASEAEKPKRQSKLERARKKRDKLWQELQRVASWNVLTVRFNAWQSEDAKQIWAGLAQVVSERLEGALSWPERARLRVSYAWNKRRSELLVNLLLPVLVALAVIVYFRADGVAQLGAMLLEPTSSQLLSTLLPVGSILFFVWLATRRILQVVQPVSERIFSYMQLPSYREQMGYQHRVMDDLCFVHKQVKRRWHDCKVVVFIDDLDRCSEEKIMEILQAINLILGGSNFFVFLGMDTDMIHRAIRVSYRKNQEEERLPPSFPESYLRKIVQLSFYLPETPQEMRFTYLSTLFSPAARSELEKLAANDQPAGEGSATKPAESTDPNLRYDLKLVQQPRPEQWREIEDTADELEAFHDYLPFLEDNPREIKRLVNIHRLVKIFLQRRNTAWQRDRQRKLVKWLIFCATWPDLIDDILKDSESSSENRLVDLAEQLDMEKAKDDAQAFEKFKKFAEQQDKLASQDIDDDFIRAAHISQMISESKATVDPQSP